MRDHLRVVDQRVTTALAAICGVQARLDKTAAEASSEKARTDVVVAEVSRLKNCRCTLVPVGPFATDIVSLDGRHRMLCKTHLDVVLRVSRMLGLEVTHQSGGDARVTCAWGPDEKVPCGWGRT